MENFALYQTGQDRYMIISGDGPLIGPDGQDSYYESEHEAMIELHKLEEEYENI